MKSTIDRAGRIVIPAPIRERAGFLPGSELEVALIDGAVELRRAVSGPKLVKRGNRWVAVPTVPPEQLPKVDIEKLIEEERDRWPW